MATTPGLRPLGLGEILDVGIKLYLRNWRPLMACVVWVVLPVQIVSVLVLLSIAPETLDITSEDSGVDPGEEGAFFAAQGVVTVLQGLVYLISTAACFKAVSDAYLGFEPSARRSLAFGLKGLPRLLALMFVVLLGFAAYVALLVVGGTTVLVIGILLAIVPLIWLSVAWALAIPALLFERIGPIEALRRSFRLVRGRWWMIALTMLVGVVLVSLVAGILQAILIAIPALAAEGNEAVAAFATVVANTFSNTITTPFTAAVIALIYFDQRVRKEGFDLQLLAEGLGRERDPDAAVPAPLLEPAITPEERAQAPFWPPPPGWQPPGREGPPPGEPAPPQGEPAPPARGWEPPRPPAWPPPETPDRGSGGS